jgi:hypothetical protein
LVPLFLGGNGSAFIADELETVLLHGLAEAAAVLGFQIAVRISGSRM